MSEQHDAFDNSVITSKGPVSGVTVHAHMRQGPHSVMEYTLDLAVIVELMFLFAEQARRGPDDPPIEITPAALLRRLKELGVKSANGSGSIGRDAIYQSFARIRGKGYLRLINHRKDNKSAGTSYEFYEFPAWNPAPPPLPSKSESPQVGAASGNAGSGNAGSRSKNRTSRSSPQVGAASGNAGSGNAGSRSPGRVSPQVGAASGNAGSPPHPPEEVDTSSPYPLSAGAQGLPSQRGEEAGGFASEDIQAAEGFLQRLPKPWTAGRATARKCGPKLLRVMAEQGWPTIHAVDRDLLTRELTKNPGKIDSYAHILPARIADLPLYEMASSPSGPAKTSEHPSGGPVAVECDKGCDRGYLDLEEGVTPCECLPRRLAAAAANQA